MSTEGRVDVESRLIPRRRERFKVRRAPPPKGDKGGAGRIIASRRSLISAQALRCPSSPRLNAALVVAKTQRVRNSRAHASRDFFQSQAKGLNAAARNGGREVVSVHRQLVDNPNDLLACEGQRVF